MRFIFLGVDYYPQTVGIAPFNTKLAEYLVSVGHKVTFICTAPRLANWKIVPGYKNSFISSEGINGVNVKRTYCRLPKANSGFERIIFEVSFSITSFFVGCFSGKFDYVICVSPPLFLCTVGRFISLLKGAKNVLYIQDIVPDLGIILGMLRKRRVINLARRYERFAYSQADIILTISEGMRGNIISKGVSQNKVLLYPDFMTLPSDSDTFHEKDHREDFILLFSGSIGEKTDLELFIDAAALLRKELNLQFVFTGTGINMDRLASYARRLNVSNVRFDGYLPEGEFKNLMKRADICIFGQKMSITNEIMPSKLLNIMANQKPIIAVAHEKSETKRVIDAAECGVCLTHRDPNLLKERILELSRKKDLLRAMGRNGFRYVKMHHDAKTLLPRFLKLLQKK
ncbi:MAG: glycosyltransferase family 4 protein [Deltaproteobacteria bacterium]|nr:glycosyltransferase family 4 protein [Deltaproteobacteria bacterium]